MDNTQETTPEKKRRGSSFKKKNSVSDINPKSEKHFETEAEMKVSQEEMEAEKKQLVIAPDEKEKPGNCYNTAEDNVKKNDENVIETLEEDVDQGKDKVKQESVQKESHGLMDSFISKLSFFSKFRRKKDSNQIEKKVEDGDRITNENTGDNNPEIVVSNTDITLDSDQTLPKDECKKKDNLYDDELLPVSLHDIEECKKRGKDEVDAASIWSFVMKKDFRYYFQHPYLRLFIAYLVTLCNFLIYAEDPVAHSLKECSIPLIGSNFAFVITGYAPNAWAVLQVFLWLVGIVSGLIMGKLLIHDLLFNRLFRLRMFENDMGSWMTMFLTCLISVFICSCLYNGFLLIGGDSTEDFRISFQGFMGITNSLFMKMAACGTWCGDFFTAWMVTDMMLQEKLYPNWAKSVKKWWNAGYHRIVLFWVITSLMSFTVVLVIATDYIQWDKLNRDILPSNELSRSFLASFILVMDILIVLQDWDFPHFISAIDIKLPGVNTAHIKFNIPKCLKRDVWKVHIEGKWFNYGILFLVIILDLNMWKNQMFYAPYDYGQYVDSDGKIYSVQDEYSLETFNATQLTYDYRSVNINPATNQTYVSTDSVMNTQYLGYSISVKGIAFLPCVSMFVLFGVLVWKFGRRKPSEEDLYAGRLKKRRKRPRISFKSLSLFVSKFRLRRKSKGESTSAELTHFKKRDQDKKGEENVNTDSNERVETFERKDLDKNSTD